MAQSAASSSSPGSSCWSPWAYYAGQRMLARHAADADAVSVWATDHGYTYVERDDQTWTNRWHFAPFGLGTHQHASHVVAGRHGELAVAAFDYTYETSTAPGPGQVQGGHATWHFAMIVVTLPSQVPWFDARKRRHHLLPHHDGNEFTIGDEAFDDEYIVHADNRGYALSALSPQFRSMVIDQKLQGVHVVDGRLFGGRDQTHETSAILPRRLQALAEAAAALPPVPAAT